MNPNAVAPPPAPANDQPLVAEDAFRARVGRILRRLLREPAFVVAAAILLVAAVGLQATVRAMQLHFRKQPVYPRIKLTDLPPAMGGWAQVTQDELAEEVREELDTDLFVFREYVHAAALGRSADQVLKSLEGKDWKQRREEFFRWQMLSRRAALRLGFTYYTGKADTVAHVPDRCFVASGHEMVGSGEESWRIGSRELPVRILTFESQADRAAPKVTVAYFFHVNGRYTSDRTAVRLALQNLRVRRAYYAKVEMMSMAPDREHAAEAMKSFLAGALPEIEKAWPDPAALSAK